MINNGQVDLFNPIAPTCMHETLFTFNEIS